MQSVPETESHPVHPLKIDKRFGVTFSVTTVLRLYVSEQSDPHEIPEGLDVTVPSLMPVTPFVLRTMSAAVTVKLPALVAVPPAAVTLTGPVVAAVGTVA